MKLSLSLSIFLVTITMHSMEMEKKVENHSYTYFNLLPGDLRRQCIQEWTGFSDINDPLATPFNIMKKLHTLIENDNQSLAHLIYFFYCNERRRVKNLNSFFLKAAALDAIESMKYLLRTGIDINFQDNNGDTALHHCASNGSTQCLQLLLAIPHINFSLKDNLNYTPYDCAYVALEQNNDHIKKLFQKVHAPKSIRATIYGKLISIATREKTHKL